VIKDLYQKGRIDAAFFNALAFQAASFGAKDLELDNYPASSMDKTPK
jgi:hypothetical protein